MSEIRDNSAVIGLNLDSLPSQIKKGQLTFALNALVEGWDGHSYTYQSEHGNEECFSFPEGYVCIGVKNFSSQNKFIYWLVNPSTGDSEIGVSVDCVYTKVINDKCLGFDINFPIKKAVVRKNEVYWTTGNPNGDNNLMWLDFDNLPYKTEGEDCDVTFLTEIDCNKMRMFPHFSIPSIEIVSSDTQGEIPAGTLQFGVAYTDEVGTPYTSFYNFTNPISIHDPKKITSDFNYTVNKSLLLNIFNIDDKTNYRYITLCVVKTVNNISTFEVVGTYEIRGSSLQILYTGQRVKTLSTEEIFQKYPIYTSANDIFTVQGVLGLAGVTEAKRVNYQKIFNKISLKWETWRISNKEGYKNEINTAYRRGYMGDEVYPIEGVFILKNGKETDRHIIPGRAATEYDLEIVSNSDVFNKDNECIGTEPTPRWKVYNTATIIGETPEYIKNHTDKCWEGPYQYGEFGYYESTETYPCDEDVWGDLAGKPIRLPRFPDRSQIKLFDKDYIYPLGIRIDLDEIKRLIEESDLTREEKDEIVGIKIVRGNRANNKSVIAKGLLFNVLKYSEEGAYVDAVTGEAGLSEEESVKKYVEDAREYANKSRKSARLFTAPILSDLTECAYRELDILYRHNITILDPRFKELLDKASRCLEGSVEEAEARGRDKIVAYSTAALQMVQYLYTLIELEQEKQELALEEFEEDEEEVEDREYIKYFPNYLYNDVRNKDPFLENIIYDEDSMKRRYTFHSPDTSFFQPSLGSVLKLEAVQLGTSRSHIRETLEHAKYQFPTMGSFITAMISGLTVGFASGEYGTATKVFDGAAAFAAYSTVIDIIYKVTPFKNPAYQYNSIGNYTSSIPIPDNGNKQRNIELGAYLLSGNYDVGDDHIVNNYQRESSVYLKVSSPLPFTHENVTSKVDRSKLLVPTYNTITSPISSYYASIKRTSPNQWGQVYSYESVDTGFIAYFDKDSGTKTVFGGDIFICKFGFKKKLPIFRDHRVGVHDGSGVFYNEIPNVGKPKYWFSTDARKNNSLLGSVFGIKPHKFFWGKRNFFNESGHIFLFIYSIPYFWCESEVNVDMRQAYNDKEGNFFPNVSSGIPEEWLQEKNVSIQHDNTYHYNKTYSKQNKENYFTFHLPFLSDRTEKERKKNLEYKIVYSEPETSLPRNNWLIYKPISSFILPQTSGKLISIDSIANNGILVRFENNSKIYNAQLKLETSGPQAIALGNSELFTGTPPIEFSDSEVEFAGSQHKMLIKTPYGNIFTDCSRGKIFLVQGTEIKDLSSAEFNVKNFFERELPFKILKYFPSVDVDNTYKGIGITGVFDGHRVIITKLDAVPKVEGIVYKEGEFFFEGEKINIEDDKYFCNASFTISFDFSINAWCSFHSYTPNFYLSKGNVIYTGHQNSVWKHKRDAISFNKFYGKIHPYILEYPISLGPEDEIVQYVKDNTKALKYSSPTSYVKTDEYFNKAIIYNEEQNSGLLELVKKPIGNLFAYRKYPIFKENSKEILYSKTDGFYNYNGFWDISIDKEKNNFIEGCSIYKELNNNNLNYKNIAFKKPPIRGKECRVRHIKDNSSEYKLVSQFILLETQKSTL